jgi:hypothetical protein
MEQAKEEEALCRLVYVSHWAKEKQGFHFGNDLTQFSEGHDTLTDSSPTSILPLLSFLELLSSS